MRKIAIVEDSNDNRDFLYYLLRDEFAVTRYETGEEALQHFEQNPPELVVLDIWLDGLDGVEVLKQVRQMEALRSVPVIALTANAMIGDREKYLAAGFDEYVSKPIVDIDAFLFMVRRLLSKPGQPNQH